MSCRSEVIAFFSFYLKTRKDNRPSAAQVLCEIQGKSRESRFNQTKERNRSVLFIGCLSLPVFVDFRRVGVVWKLQKCSEKHGSYRAICCGETRHSCTDNYDSK